MGRRKIKNMEEFAEISGISRPTLSKYFHNPESVRVSTREKIELALDQNDYRPNIFAINQNRKLTKTIGVVVPYLADPFFAEIVRVIQERISEAGFSPSVFSSYGKQGLENEILDTLRSMKPAGVLFAPLGRSSDKAHIEQFCREVPTVLFDSNIDGVGQAFVGSDNLQFCRQMVEYLCRTGTPPTFFEMDKPPNPNANKRRSSYLETMEKLGHEPHIIRVEGEGWQFEEIGYREGKKILRGDSLPARTILCSNDRLAIGLIAAAFELGIKVGHGSGCDLRIAGHDDHPFSRFTCPPLTTVAQDYGAISERSLSTLLNIIETGKPKEKRVEALFEGHLVIRASA
jgi:DNA-binding LacI/PurR family transcriptional regulator